MSANSAHIIIKGNVGKEIKNYPPKEEGKKDFTKFSIAWQATTKDSATGKTISAPPVWVDVLAYGALAKQVAEKVTTGQRLLVTGSIRPDVWSGEKGPQTRLVVVADTISVELWALDN